MFSCEFCEIFKNTFFTEHTPGDCFWISKTMFKFWFIFHIQNLWYSFTGDNSFLQILSQSKNPSLSTSGHTNIITALMCIFSSILNCSYPNQKNSKINEWKCMSKGLLKGTFFVTKKVIRKQTSSLWNVLQPPIKFTSWSLKKNCILLWQVNKT